MKRLVLVSLALLCLSACGGRVQTLSQYNLPKTEADPASERFLSLKHQRGGSVAVTYYKNGIYDQKALQKINNLLRDRSKGEVKRIDRELLNFLVDLRTRLGLPETVIFEVLSGYRSPQTNAKLRQKNAKVARQSYHMKGEAVDVRLAGVSGKAITEIAKTMQRGGAAYYVSTDHVHLDTGPIRTWRTK